MYEINLNMLNSNLSLNKFILEVYNPPHRFSQNLTSMYGQILLKIEYQSLNSVNNYIYLYIILYRFYCCYKVKFYNKNFNNVITSL